MPFLSKLEATGKRIEWIRLLYNLQNSWCFEQKKRFVDRPLMSSLRLELTNRCNLSCRMCANRLMTRARGDMPEEVFYKVIQEIPDHSLQQLSFFTIGESLLHPRLFEYVHTSRHKAKIRLLSTNGMLLDNDDKIKRLFESGLNHLRFSIDGYTKDNYEAVRKAGDFDRLIHNIQRVKMIRDNLKCDVKLDMLYTMVNINNWDELLRAKAFFKPFFDEILFHPVNNQGRDDVHVAAPVDFLKYKYFSEDRHYPCGLLWLEPTVLWDGKVSICCLDYDGDLIVGDVRTDSLMKIWENALYREHRCRQRKRDFLHPKCRICFQIKTNAYRFYEFNKKIRDEEKRLRGLK